MMSLSLVGLICLMEVFLIFKILPIKMALFVLLIFWLVQLSALGLYFAPRKNSTLKNDFEKISKYYDELALIQENLNQRLSDIEAALPIFYEYKKQVSLYEKAFEKPEDAIHDKYCIELFQISLIKFQAYEYIADVLFKLKEDDGKNSDRLEKMKMIDAANRMQLATVALRVKSLDGSYVDSIMAGIASWLHLATKMKINN
jgi:hypothetical protein